MEWKRTRVSNAPFNRKLALHPYIPEGCPVLPNEIWARIAFWMVKLTSPWNDAPKIICAYSLRLAVLLPRYRLGLNIDDAMQMLVPWIVNMSITFIDQPIKINGLRSHQVDSMRRWTYAIANSPKFRATVVTVKWRGRTQWNSNMMRWLIGKRSIRALVLCPDRTCNCTDIEKMLGPLGDYTAVERVYVHHTDQSYACATRSIRHRNSHAGTCPLPLQLASKRRFPRLTHVRHMIHGRIFARYLPRSN